MLFIYTKSDQTEITAQQIQDIMNKFDNSWQGLTKYIDHRQEKGRNQKRHSNFYRGLYANVWLESWQMFAVETHALMNFSIHNCVNYQRGIRAATFIQSRL